MYGKKYTFLNMFKWIVFVYSTNASQLSSFYHCNFLDGHVCQGNDVAFTIKGASAVQCSYLCTRHALCVTLFFDVQQCTGCTKAYRDTQALLAAGNVVAYTSQMFQSEPCNNHAECLGDLICFTDKCVCVPGFSYDPNTESCKTECTTYGNTYQDYDRRRVLDNHFKQLVGHSLKICKRKCTAKSICRAIEYSKNRSMCNLASATALSHSNDFQLSDEFMYAQRNCG